MKDATELQMEVLRFCKEQESKNGRFPTHREIGKRFSWASTVSVRAHLIALEKKGLVEKIGRYYRTKNAINWRAELLKLAMCPTINPGELLQKRQREALKLLEENPA